MHVFVKNSTPWGVPVALLLLLQPNGIYAGVFAPDGLKTQIAANLVNFLKTKIAVAQSEVCIGFCTGAFTPAGLRYR